MSGALAVLAGYVVAQALMMWRDERRFRREQKAADEACLLAMDGEAAEFRADLEGWAGRS